MDSFQPKIIRINAQKRPEHLKDSILDAEGNGEGLNYEEDDVKAGGLPGFDIEPYAKTFIGFWKMVGR